MDSDAPLPAASDGPKLYNACSAAEVDYFGERGAVNLREIFANTSEHTAAVRLRNAVLREPLGLDFTPEEVADEPHNFHLAAFAEEALVAVLLLKPMDAAIVKMRQVAVAPEWQGRGVGAQLVRFAEEFARAKGYRTIYAHARSTALRFYVRHGYVVEGEEFIEVTVPHQRIVKVL